MSLCRPSAIYQTLYFTLCLSLCRSFAIYQTLYVTLCMSHCLFSALLSLSLTRLARHIACSSESGTSILFVLLSANLADSIAALLHFPLSCCLRSERSNIAQALLFVPSAGSSSNASVFPQCYRLARETNSRAQAREEMRVRTVCVPRLPITKENRAREHTSQPPFPLFRDIY